MSRNDSYPQHVVTAVIVAHDGAPWLPHVVDALLGQTRPVQRVVAVDTGSRDRSGGLLAARLGQGVVFGMDRSTGYGAAVAKALAHKAANTPVPGSPAPGRSPRGGQRGQGDRVEWVWLLHDDCEPAPDALEQLLRGAAETPRAAVLGPKVRDWSDRDVILEAGLTIDMVGRRITGIEPREVDQGQHDGDRDALAVGSPGLLVRREVWDMVRGFDPELGMFRDDIDFCWRVHAAGFRVRVITDAVVYHAQAAARRRRPVSVGRRPQLLDRRNALLTLGGNLPLRPMLGSLAGGLAVSFLRVLFFLLAKRVTAALDETAAVASVLLHPLRLLRVRRLRARGRKAAYGRLRSEIPPGRSLRRVAEFIAAMFGTAQQDTAGSHHASEDPDAADDFLLTDSGIVQRTLTNPSVLLLIGLAAVTGAAERSLLGAGTLAGGALLPAGGAAGLWHTYLQGFHPTGIGSPSVAPPYLAIMAMLSTILIGKAWLAVDVVLLGSVPIAGMLAYLAIRHVTRSVFVRVWAAAAYALIPVASGAISAGRLGTAAAFVLVPVIGLQAGRMFSQPPRIARRAAWGTGLAVAVAAAFVPLVWPIALLAAVVAALALRARRTLLINLGIASAVPPVLLIPWTFQLAAHPSALLLEVGVQQPGLAAPDLAARSLMLLSPGGPGLPPMWVTAGLILVALVALFGAPGRRLVVAGWAVAVLGLLVAVPVSRLSVRPVIGGAPVTVWPGAALAIAAAGLLLAAAAGAEALGIGTADEVSGVRRFAPRGVRGAAAVLLAIAACSAPAAAAAFWVLKGVAGPVGAAPGQVVPPLVAASVGRGTQLRTLVLSSAGSRVFYQLLRGDGLTLGDADLAPVPAAERTLAAAVAALTAPDGNQAADQSQALARLDIGFVLMRAPINQTLASTLDGASGLRPVSMSQSFGLWRLTSLPSRIAVLEASGAVVPVRSGPIGVSGAPVPSAGGTLLLAEPAGGWQASLNGHALTSVPSPSGSWAQAFRLPSGGGTLELSHGDLTRHLAIILELLIALAVAALALPGVRTAAEAQAVPAIPAVPAPARTRARELPEDGLPGDDDRPEDYPAREPVASGSGDGLSGWAPTGRAAARAAAAAQAPVPAGITVGDETAYDDERPRAAGHGRGREGERDAGRAGRSGKGHSRGRGLRRRGRSGPPAPAASDERRPQPAGAGRDWDLADGAGLAAAGSLADASGRPGADREPGWADPGLTDMPLAAEPARRSPSGAGPLPDSGPVRAGRGAARSPTGAWPYPEDDADFDMPPPGQRSYPAPPDAGPGGSYRPGPDDGPPGRWQDDGRSRRGRPEPDQGPGRRDPYAAAPPLPPRPQPSSWATGDQAGGWPSYDQPGAWPPPDQGSRPSADGSSSRPGADGRPDWPAGAAGSRRAAARDPRAPEPRGRQQGPRRRSGAHRSGGAGYDAGGRDGQDDRRADGHQPGWSGSDDSLEPLPSADGRDDRSRRRWPGPDGDDRDDGGSW